MAPPRYRRRGVSPSNPGIVILIGEDGREVPVTAELANTLAPTRDEYDRPVDQDQRGIMASEGVFPERPFDQSYSDEEAAIMNRPSVVTPADVAGYAREPQPAPQGQFQGEQPFIPIQQPTSGEARLGGPSASEPLAQDFPTTGGGRIRPRHGTPPPMAPPVPPTEAADFPQPMSAAVGLAEAQARQAEMDSNAGRFFRQPDARAAELDAANAQSAASPPIPGTEASAVAPGQAPAQPAPAGPGAPPSGSGMMTPLQAWHTDLNGNHIPDLLEQRSGGGGSGNKIVTSRTVQAPISPGTLDELGYRTNVRREAEAALGDTVAEGIAGITDLERGTQQQLAGMDQERLAAQQKSLQQLHTMGQRRQEAAQRLLSGRVDPERYLGSRGTAGRVGASIAMTLRDVAGIYAGRDLGPTLIMREIDRDIAAQEANLDQSYREFQAGGQLMQEMRQIYNDDDAARLAARATLIEDAIRRVRIATLSSANAEARARGMVVEAQLQQQAALTQAQLEQQAWSATITQTQRLGGAGGSRGPMMTPEAQNAYRQAWIAEHGEGQGAEPPPYGASFIDAEGQRVWGSVGREQRGNVIEMLGRSDQMISGLQELRDLTANGSRLSPNDRGRASSLIGELELTIAVMQDQGALQAPDAERVRRQLTEFTSYDPREMVGALSAIETTLRRSRTRAHLIARRFGINPNGAQPTTAGE